MAKAKKINPARQPVKNTGGNNSSTGSSASVPAGSNVPTGQCSVPVSSAPPKSWSEKLSGCFQASKGGDKNLFQILCGGIGAVLLIWCMFKLSLLIYGGNDLSFYLCLALGSGLLFGVYIGGEPYAPLILAFVFFACAGYVEVTGKTIGQIVNNGRVPIGTSAGREEHKSAQQALEDAQMKGEANILHAVAKQTVYVFVEDFEEYKAGQECLALDKKSENGFFRVKFGKSGVYKGKEILVPAVILRIKDQATQVMTYGRERLAQESRSATVQLSAKAGTPTVLFTNTYTEADLGADGKVVILDFTTTKIIPGDILNVNTSTTSSKGIVTVYYNDGTQVVIPKNGYLEATFENRDQLDRGHVTMSFPRGCNVSVRTNVVKSS